MKQRVYVIVSPTMPTIAITPPPASSPAVRRSMLGNRRVDTKPEVLLRQLLHRAGLRFRKDRLIPLAPRGVRVDVVFPRQRVAVFMDGCYWHRCPEHGTMPSTNNEYWRAKFETNMARDARNNAELARDGWHVIRIWEHEVLDDDLAAHAVSRVLSAVRKSTVRRPRPGQSRQQRTRSRQLVAHA